MSGRRSSRACSIAGARENGSCGWRSKARRPAAGTPVLDGDLPVGTLGAASGGFALALLRLDRVEEARAAGRTLKAAGRRVRSSVP